MSLKRSLAWMALAQVCALVLQFAASVVLARYLTPYETGIYAVALAMVGILALMQALGLQSLIVREENLNTEIRTTAFTVNACICVLLSIGIAAISLFGGSFLHDEGVQKAILALAVTPLFGIFAFLPSAELERSGSFQTLALVGIAGNIAGTIATITLAIHGFSYMSIAYAQWVTVGVQALVLNIIGYRYASYRLGYKAWRRVGHFGLQMFAVSSITSLSMRLSDIMLGRLLGLGTLGIYNRASGLNGLIWNNIHVVIARVVFVDFAALHRRGIPLRERYLRILAIMTATLWPAFAGLGILARPFIMTVYGERWLPAAFPLLLIAVGSMIKVGISMTWEVFAVMGELRAQTRIVCTRVALSFPIFLAACTVSINAAAAATIVEALLAFVLYAPYLNRMTKTSLGDFLPIYARSALVTILAITPAVFVMISFQMSADIPRMLEGAAVVGGLLLWTGGLFFVKHPLADELFGTLHRLWSLLNQKPDQESQSSHETVARENHRLLPSAVSSDSREQ
ncbi:MAG: oligosaccharide flippase family protein [Hyphomicrobiales bacterium]|nr:oligosaccharide flippase family protein [Hyphomicrobiales bacterium]